MHRLIILIFLASCFTAFAETEFNYRMVEDSSYSLYLKKDWKQLETFGAQAIKNKIDYFYLRERMGIAFYEQQKYQSAAPQFDKAYQFNSSDELLQEYLFYSYAFNNRYDNALRLTKGFSKDLKKKTGTEKPAPINYAQIDFTVKIPSRSDLVLPLYNLGISFNHRITRGYSVFHAYSFTYQRYTGGIYNQHKYFVSANIPLPKGFSMQPAFSFMADQYSDTVFSQPSRPPQRPTPPQINKKTYFSFLGSLNLSKVFPYAKLDLTNAFSNLDTVYQIQHSLGLTVYPLSNQKLSLSATAILHTNDFYKTFHPLVQAGIHFNAPKFFAMAVVYTYANVYNFHLYNGLLVQNGYDLLKHNVTVVPEFIIKNRFSIYAAYQLEFKTTRETKINYIAHGISFGTKLRF